MPIGIKICFQNIVCTSLVADKQNGHTDGRMKRQIENIVPALTSLADGGITRGQSNLTKSASRGANSPVRGHTRGSKVVPLNSWGRVSY